MHALIGRSAEVQEWARLLAVLPDGGGVLRVGGEAGIGKSRLVAEFARLAADAGARVLRGAARETTVGAAYAPLIEAFAPLTRTENSLSVQLPGSYRAALGPIVPDWRRPGMGAESEGIVLAEGVVRLLAGVARGPGTVLIIEDIHCADPDTLDVLDHLARAADSVPVLLVTTTRVERLAPGPGIRALTRLDPAEQQAMLRTVLGGIAVPEDLTRMVSERAEGLPLAIEEILADLRRIGGLRQEGERWFASLDLVGAATAPSIEAMVAARIEGLPPEALAAATAAALLDDVVSWQRIAPVAALDDDTAAAALRLLAASHVVEQVGAGRYRYRHGLIREAVLGCVPPSLVRASAERAARAMGATPEPAQHAKAARLFTLAERPHEAAEHYAQASRRWLELGALRSAEAAAREALRLDASGQLAAELRDLLSECLARMGQFAEALEFLDSANGNQGRDISVDERRPDPTRAMAARCRAVRCALEIGDLAAAGAYLDDAEQFGGINSEVASLRATLAYEIGDGDEAARQAEHAVRLAEASRVHEHLCAALHIAARIGRTHDPADALPALERLHELAVTEDLPEWRERALLDLGLVDGLTTGDTERLRRARDEAASRGALHTQAVAEMNLWLPLLEHGDLDEAQLMCDHAAQLATRYDLRVRGVAVAMRAILASFRGRADQARVIAEGIGPDLGGRTNHEFFSALCAGDVAAAMTVVDPHAETLNAFLPMRPAPIRGFHALLSATQRLDPGSAEKLLAAGAGTWFNRGLALLATAVVLGRRGERTRAEELSARAYADLEFSPVTAAFATIHAAPYALADGWGAPAEWLRDAHARFTLLGNGLMRQRCEAAMRAARIPVPRRGRGEADVPAHLRAVNVTSREMDVLLLLARNLTNNEIADHLSLSPRTIDSHVSRLLAKTGCDRRAQLAALLET